MQKEKTLTVKLIDVKDGPIRVRADSMRKTVIVDVDDGQRKPQVIMLPRNFDVLDSLGIALCHVARVQSNWKDGTDEAANYND